MFMHFFRIYMFKHYHKPVTMIGSMDSFQSVFSLICLLNEHINVIVKWKGFNSRHNDVITLYCSLFVAKEILIQTNCHT